MKVTLRTETDLRVNMDTLLDECIDRLDWQKRRAEQGRLPNGLEYGSLEELVGDSLEFIYDVDLCYYDNGLEVREVVAKNLLIWCLEKDYIEEHNRLEELC